MSDIKKLYKQVVCDNGFEFHIQYSPDRRFENYLQIGINKNAKEEGRYFCINFQLIKGSEITIHAGTAGVLPGLNFEEHISHLIFKGGENFAFLMACLDEIPKDLDEFFRKQDGPEINLWEIYGTEVISEKDMFKELLREKSPDLNNFPRKLDREDVRSILGDLRFDMSGYNTCETGDCMKHNQMVLDKFGKFGIYNYTEYLHLDFYKGSPRLHYRYWRDDEHHFEDDMYGWSTSEIILRILEITVYSGKEQRRNWA